MICHNFPTSTTQSHDISWSGCSNVLQCFDVSAVFTHFAEINLAMAIVVLSAHQEVILMNNYTHHLYIEKANSCRIPNISKARLSGFTCK